MAAQEDKKVEEKLDDLKVDELKDRCRDAGLKVGGTKAELIARLKEKSDDKAGGDKSDSDKDSDKDDKDDKNDKAKEGDKSNDKDAKKDVDMKDGDKDGDDAKMGGGDKKDEKAEEKEFQIEVDMLLEGCFEDKKKGDKWFEVKVLEVMKGDDETLYKVQWTYDDDPNTSELPRSKLRKVGGAPLDAKKEEKKEEKSDDELVICIAMLLEGLYKDPKKGDWWYEVKILEIIDGDGDEKTYKVKFSIDDSETVLKKDEIRKPGGGKSNSSAPAVVEKVDKLNMSLDDLIATDTKPKGKGKGKSSGGGSSWGGGGGGSYGSGGGNKWGGSGGASWKDGGSKPWSKDDSGSSWGAKKSWEAPARKSWDGGDDKWASKKPAWDSGDKYGKSSYGDKSYGGGSSKYDKYDSKSSYDSKGYDKYDSKGSYDSRDKGGDRDRRDAKADDDRDRRRDSGRDHGGSSGGRTWGSGGGRDAPARAPVEGATVVVSGIQGLRLDARDLEKAFAAVGTVESAVMKGANALISFSSRRCATEAVRRFHGGQLNDRTIDVALEGEAPARHKGSGGGRSRSPRQAERSPPRSSRGHAPAAGGRSRSRGRTGGSSAAAAKQTSSRPAASGGGRTDDRRRARSPAPRGGGQRPYR